MSVRHLRIKESQRQVLSQSAPLPRACVDSSAPGPLLPRESRKSLFKDFYLCLPLPPFWDSISPPSHHWSRKTHMTFFVQWESASGSRSLAKPKDAVPHNSVTWIQVSSVNQFPSASSLCTSTQGTTWGGKFYFSARPKLSRSLRFLPTESKALSSRFYTPAAPAWPLEPRLAPSQTPPRALQVTRATAGLP